MFKHIILIIVGILCILYGFVIMSVNSGTRFYAVWYSLGAFLIVLAALGLAGVWNLLPPAVVKTVLILFALLAVLMIGTVIAVLAGGTAEDEECSAVIVLGAQVKPSGPSVVLRFRLDAAADYLAEHRNTTCIVSGGQGYNEPCTEAEAMSRYLEAKGIDRNRIIQERKATSTRENVEYSKEFCDFKNGKIGIVTNSFHMFRSALIAKKAGYADIVRIPAGSLPLYLPNNVLRECLAVWKDLICGNLI